MVALSFFLFLIFNDCFLPLSSQLMVCSLGFFQAEPVFRPEDEEEQNRLALVAAVASSVEALLRVGRLSFC